MAVRLLRLFTLVCSALVTGLAFAHVLELPPKLAEDPRAYVEMQHSLYRYYAVVGAPLEVLAIVGAVALAVALRGRGRVFALTLAGAVLLAAGLAEWALVVQPANVEFGRWTPDRVPAGWTMVRDRWEYGHAGHFVLFGAGFVVLLWSVLAPSRGEARGAPRE